jgi:hypothetical protein
MSSCTGKACPSFSCLDESMTKGRYAYGVRSHRPAGWHWR